MIHKTGQLQSNKMILTVRVAWITFLIVLQFSLTTGELAWRKSPVDSKVRIGQNVTFWCEIDGLTNPNLRVIWQKRNTILFVDHTSHEAPAHYKIMGSKERGEFNMMVTQAQRSDDDTFTCSVSQSLKQQAMLTVLVPPEIPQLKLDRTGELIVGQIVRFNCSSPGGNPAPSVIWRRNNVAIASGFVTTPAQVKFGMTSSVLTWTLSKDDHTAMFSCLVENEAISGAARSTSTTLQVQYGPEVSFSPEGAVRVLEQDSIVLTCNVDANPSVTSVTWFRDGTKQPGTGISIQITNAEPSPQKTHFECVAGNKISEGRNTTTVDVIYPPKVRILQAVNGRVVINESRSLSLTCSVEANPAAHMTLWRREGSEPVSGPSLTIDNVRRHQGGLYSCEAANHLLPTGKPARNGFRNTSVELVVQYAPGVAEITQQPKGQVNQGQELILRCTTDQIGNPVGKLLWTKEGDSGFHFEGSELRLRPARLEHNGVYTCIPANLVGVGTPAKREITINEAVSFLMPVLEPVKYVHISDTDIYVTCRVRGKPLPQITWYKNGQAIPESSTEKFTVEKAQASIDVYSYIVTSQLLWKGSSRSPFPSSLFRDDTGNYTCLASNNAANDMSRTVNFQVQYAPQVTVSRPRVGVDMNQSASLSCSAHALPRPQFEWYHMDQKLHTGGRYSIQVMKAGEARGYESVLNISSVQHADLGQYQCRVTNDYGNTTAFLHLTVKNVPEEPRSLSMITHTWESMHLQWVPGFNGGYPQSFVISVTSPTRPARRIDVNPPQQTTYNVTGLYPQTEYVFKVFAKNILGSGSYSPSLTMVTHNIIIPPPENPVYDGSKKVLTFRSPSNHYCARIFISADGRQWELREPCAPSVGGSVKITTSTAVNHVNISLCMERRPEICGSSVRAKMVHMAEASAALMIGVGCACGLVVVILLIAVIVIYLYRRKQIARKAAEMNSQMATTNGHLAHKKSQGVDNPIRTPADITDGEKVEERRHPSTDHRQQYPKNTNISGNGYLPNNNHRGPITNGHCGKLQNSSNQWGYGDIITNTTPPPEYTQNSSNFNHFPTDYTKMGYNQIPDHNSGYHGNSQNQSLPKTTLSPIFESNNKNVNNPYGKTIRHNSDFTNSEMNSSGESVGHFSSGSSQGLAPVTSRYFPIDGHYHGDDSESGYSTPEPAKPKKKKVPTATLR